MVFGGEGNDTITAGTADDVLFGDIGRVDYLNDTGEIITRLGHSISENPVNPPVANEVSSATASTLTDDTANFQAGGLVGFTVQVVAPNGAAELRTISSNTTNVISVASPWTEIPDDTYFYRILFNAANVIIDGMPRATLTNPLGDFETEYDGLVGLTVQVISPASRVQFRQIIANTTTELTLDRPWDTLPVANHAQPQQNFSYRIPAVPEQQTDGVIRGPRVVWSIENETLGNDTLKGGNGDDVIIGGGGQDRIDGNAGDDWIAGDNARFDFEPVTGSDGPTEIKSIHTRGADIGDVDTVSGNAGADLIFGGNMGDTLYGDDANELAGTDDLADVILGDNGGITFRGAVVSHIFTTDVTQTTGGADTVSGHAGDDIILGGINGSSDILSGNTGNDILLGDNGELIYDDGADPDLATLDVIRSFTDGLGGIDEISGNAGSDKIFGGSGGDSIYGDDNTASSGVADLMDFILGDNGEIILTNNMIAMIATTDMTEETGGADTIAGNAGNDFILGGVNNGGVDIISGNEDADVIMGDNGELFYNVDADLTTLDLVQTTDTDRGGSDRIFGNTGEDLVLGGKDGDFISGDENHDIALGDFGKIIFTNGVLMAIEPTDLDLGGPDTIFGGSEEDILIGGTDGDNIDGEENDDLIFGDNVVLALNIGSGDSINPRYRELLGTTLYDENGLVQVNGQHQPRPGGNPAWADWTITLDQSLIASHFGDDYIAGGAADDTIFGQRGDDTIQGDGSIEGKIDGMNPVAAGRDGSLTGLPGLIEVGTLQVVPSFEDDDDGDDYIEGNSGSDVIFGNLGQDDIVGGSSTLFSLVDPNLRDDTDDLIFGGAGTDILRNDQGDASAASHGRDSDVILGDNGNIFRIVSADFGATTYVGFAYDDTYGEQIIVRASQLLDYTPGGVLGEPATGDIGAGDELHGESGNDFIYGQLGSDTLFGEGQDDDLIGGTDNDWISGGTGEDGVLGDDGRIYTSRNGTAEPLYGILGLSGELDQEISTPGNVQQATINVSGEIKKTVNLTPFSTDPNWIGLTDEFDGDVPHNADDIIYGGLGNDWLHGGSGDDAMSGAEALAEFYGSPINLGDVLAYNINTGEFAEYDEFEPLEAIPGFLLNFNTDEGLLRQDATHGDVFDDGSDRLFGDLGNDWLVGGTGRDNLYGGWGDDLLNADDDHGTNGGLNDGPDTHPTYEDRAYGGAGRDRLIANTGGDRLIDWAGEFNSYIVPFAPFGLGTVSRTLQPQLAQFLYDLSASDGADPTRSVDTGADAARNGEPEGELGVVRQQDFAWQSQTGGPDDPQAGNIPGGPRDVLRSASFNGQGQNQAEGFFADSGAWEVNDGQLNVSAESLGGDAVAVYHIEDVIPGYFELLGTIEYQKATGGWEANAYFIFDYISPTDFKFAGLDDKINKAVVGYRDANGWHIIKQNSVQGSVRPDTPYNMLLSVNGLSTILVVNNKQLIDHTFDPRVIDDYSFGLNYGLVGMGSNNARGTFDNIAVQILPPQITLEETEDFSGPATLTFDEISGDWTVGGGDYDTPDPADDPAMSLIDLGVDGINFNSYLELEAEVTADGRAGFVFDRYDDRFKFVAIDAVTDEIVIGHYTSKKGWVDDAVAAVPGGIERGQAYDIKVALKGTTVSPEVDGQVLLGHVFNAANVDGGFGLMSIDGAASFDDVTVKTDDRVFDEDDGEALMASGTPGESTELPEPLTQTELNPIIEEAIQRWSVSGLVDDAGLQQLNDVNFQITDLEGLMLGKATDTTVFIDNTAAGHGWFIDTTLWDDSEFDTDDSFTGEADNRMDLLTVVMHELGHVLGVNHNDSDDLMNRTLDTENAIQAIMQKE